MKQTRRFQKGKNLLYDKHFDVLLLGSLLNPEERRTSFERAGDWSNANWLRGLIREWRGYVKTDRGYKDKSDIGFYYDTDAGQMRPAKIQILEQQLPMYDKLFAEYKLTEINAGRFEPTKLSDELEAERAKCEAELDIRLTEVTYFLELIEKIPLKKPVLEPLFPYSSVHKMRRLSGSFQMSRENLVRDRVLISLTGQTIGRSKTGLRIVTDKRSCYLGMSAADFSVLAKLWTRATDKIVGAKAELERKFSLQQRPEMVAEQWEKLRIKLFDENPSWVDLFNLKFEDMSIPAFPENVTNHLNGTDEAVEPAKVKTDSVEPVVDEKQVQATEILQKEKQELQKELELQTNKK